MMKALALGMFGAILAAAAENSNPMIAAMAKHWQSSKELTIAVAEAMPADAYSFKATDAEMSFGEQMNHIAAADGNYCSAAIGTKSPFTKPENPNDKETAIKNIHAAFDYCIAGLNAMTPENLHEKVMRGKTEVTKFELFWGGFTHTAHHRGQAEVYLRLKGITPPAYKF